MAQMKGVASCLIDCGLDYVNLDTLRNKLGLGLNENLHWKLFENNILDVSYSDGETYVGFYFQKLRDYLIAYYVRKWHKTSDDELLKDLSIAIDNPVMYEAVKVFYGIAVEEKQRVIDGDIRDNAEKYVSLYTSIIDHDFPALKEYFSPKTSKDIGFIGELDILRHALTMYGFRSINLGQEVVKFIPIDARMAYSSGRDNTSYLFGATEMHWIGSSRGFTEISVPYEVVNNEVIAQLFKLVKECSLNESTCSYLSLEKVLGCLDELGFFPERYRFGVAHYLPLTFEEVDNKIRYKIAYERAGQEILKNKIGAGVAGEQWHGSVVSYNYSISDQDRHYLDTRALELMNSSSFEYQCSDVALNTHIKLLREGLSVLQKTQSNISTTILLDPDFSTRYIYGGYNETNIIINLKQIHTLFLHEYARVIELNFPTIKNEFALYKKMPLLVIISVLYDSEEPKFRVFYCENTNNSNNEVIIDFEQSFNVHWDLSSIEYNGETFTSFMSSHTGFTSLAFNIGLDAPFDYPFGVLRGMVYRHIADEIKAVAKALRNRYGLKSNEQQNQILESVLF